MPTFLRQWQVSLFRWGRWSDPPGSQRPATVTATSGLLWAERGTANFWIGNESLAVRPGMLVWLPSKEVVHYHVGPREPFQHCVIHFTLTGPNGLAWPPPGTGVRWLAPSPPRTVEARIQALADKLVQRDIGSYLLACAVLLELVAMLLSNRGGRAQRAGVAHKTAYRALALMAANIHRPFSVKQTAQQLGISPEHLAVIFRRTFGLSPKQQLFYLRMHWANSLLATTDQPVRDIALQCGFRSPSLFERAFRRWSGYSPARIRHIHGRTHSEPIPPYRPGRLGRP